MRVFTFAASQQMSSTCTHTDGCHIALRVRHGIVNLAKAAQDAGDQGFALGALCAAAAARYQAAGECPRTASKIEKFEVFPFVAVVHRRLVSVQRCIDNVVECLSVVENLATRTYDMLGVWFLNVFEVLEILEVPFVFRRPFVYSGGINLLFCKDSTADTYGLLFVSSACICARRT